MDNQNSVRPFFSICIPQYNRTEFLIKAIESYKKQSFKDFEVVITDDKSTDGLESSLINALKLSGLKYFYRINETNLKYDGNLRSAINSSSGKYLILMGNDDGIYDPSSLERLHSKLNSLHGIGVVVTNYKEELSEHPVRRVTESSLKIGNPQLASKVFRNYSFVSGIVLDGDLARAESTDIVDGSEMYQMFLATRIIASGMALYYSDEIFVTKDLQIAGKHVDSYRAKNLSWLGVFSPRMLPMGKIPFTIDAGLKPFVNNKISRRCNFYVAIQMYVFVYPYWIVEYKRSHGYGTAWNIFLGINPSIVLSSTNIALNHVSLIWLIYLILSSIAFIVPLRIFDFLRPALHKFAKRFAKIA